MSAGRPAGARPGDGMASAELWCAHCGQPVKASGDGLKAKAVHSATGDVRGAPDSHPATPVASEPPLWKDAREVAALYGGAFRVTARLGILRADWADPPAGAVVAHYTGRDRGELEAKLRAALGGGR